MTREHKLALIIGFTFVLVVGVLLSDHFSTSALSRAGGPELAEAAVRKDEAAMFTSRLPQVDKSAVASQPRPTTGTQLASATVPNQTQDVLTMGSVAGRIGDQVGDAWNDVTTGKGKPAVVLATDDPSVSSSPSTPPGAAPQPKPGPAVPAFGDPSGDRVPRNNGTDGPGHGYAALGGKPATTPGGTTATVAAGTPVPAASKSGKRYQIAENDTFWKIAKAQYNDGSLADKLKAYNADRIGKGGQLRVGGSILIPDKSVLLGKADSTAKPANPFVDLPAQNVPTKKTTTPTAADGEKSAKPSAAHTGATTYTVQANDTLSKIAAKTLGSSSRYPDILAANNMGEDDTITPGMTLKIPAR